MSMSKFYAALGLLLLVTTFSLGILLVKTIGERDVAATDLSNAKAVIKEKEKAVSDEQAEKEAVKKDFSGCKAELQLINEKTADQAIASQQDSQAADQRANDSLSTLPAQIEKDKLSGQGPTLATRWMRELFVK